MKLDRFDLVVWSTLAVIGAALAAVLFIGDRVGARVVGVTPESGAVSATGRIGIEFAQPMDTASVESSFAIEPSIPGSITWDDKTMWFAPGEPLARGAEYTARVRAGALSASGQRVQHDVVWRFTAREPMIVVIAPANESRELWAVTLDGERRPLTGTGGRVYDFAVAPDGETIAYSVANESNGIDVWLMNRDGSNQRVAADCAADRCTAPNWSPDGRRLAYSRENAGLQPGAPHGPPRAWILDLAVGQTTAVYADSQMLGHSPSWSPDGRRIASFDGSIGGIRVLDLGTGETMILQSQMGLMGAWSPDGRAMLYNDLTISGEQPRVKMFFANFESKDIAPAFESGLEGADYGAPVWSPDGDWIAAGLKDSLSGLGSQLWIMRPDGSDGRPVADDPQYTYGAYRWDAWSESLLFQRFELGQPFAKPEIFLWSSADDSTRLIAEDATMPAWLP